MKLADLFDYNNTYVPGRVIIGCIALIALFALELFFGVGMSDSSVYFSELSILIATLCPALFFAIGFTNKFKKRIRLYCFLAVIGLWSIMIGAYAMYLFSNKTIAADFIRNGKGKLQLEHAWMGLAERWVQFKTDTATLMVINDSLDVSLDTTSTSFSLPGMFWNEFDQSKVSMADSKCYTHFKDYGGTVLLYDASTGTGYYFDYSTSDSLLVVLVGHFVCGVLMVAASVVALVLGFWINKDLLKRSGK